MSTRTQARAAIVREVGQPWTIEAVEVSAPQEDEVLVRMVGTGICHTDMGCRDGHFPVPMPIVLGHEGAGVVEAVGANVSKVKVGDHVVLSFDSCGECHSCDKHLPSYCYTFYPRNLAGVRQDGSATLTQNGTPLNAVFFAQSSFATFALAREINTIVIDKSLPLDIMGPLGCGIQTGAGAAVNSLGIKKGESLAIFGGGAVGLSALLGARAVDAGTVIVVEPNAGRRALALELGATAVIDPKATEDVLAAIKDASGGGVHYTLDTTGISPVIANAVEALLPNGICGLLGVPSSPEANVPANMMSMLVRGVGVKYIVEGDADPQQFIPRMAAWYAAGKFPFDKLVKKFPFAQINEAAAASLSGEVVKPVVVF